MYPAIPEQASQDLRRVACGESAIMWQLYSDAAPLVVGSRRIVAVDADIDVKVESAPREKAREQALWGG